MTNPGPKTRPPAAPAVAPSTPTVTAPASDPPPAAPASPAQPPAGALPTPPPPPLSEAPAAPAAPAVAPSFEEAVSDDVHAIVCAVLEVRSRLGSIIGRNVRDKRDATAAAGFLVGDLLAVGGRLPNLDAHRLRWLLEEPTTYFQSADREGNISAGNLVTYLFSALECGVSNRARGAEDYGVEHTERIASVWPKHRSKADAAAEIEKLEKEDSARRKLDDMRAHHDRLARESLTRVAPRPPPPVVEHDPSDEVRVS